MISKRVTCVCRRYFSTFSFYYSRVRSVLNISIRMSREAEVTSSDMSDITTTSLDQLDKTTVSITEWTNEKHCLYLKSMEASFVNELHCSMGFFKGRADKYGLKERSSHQIMNFRDVRFWKNDRLSKYGSESVKINKDHSRVANSWIRQCQCTDKDRVFGAALSQVIDGKSNEEFESKSKPFLGSDSKSKKLATARSALSRKNVVGTNTEMMGQNFDGNNFIDSNMMRAEQKKTEKTTTADDDQVVPVSISMKMKSQ